MPSEWAVLVACRPAFPAMADAARAHRVPDVDIGAVRHIEDRWVQVYDVARGLADVQLRVDALQQRRLAGASHACAHPQP